VNKAESGHDMGLLFNSFYYSPSSKKQAMQQYAPLPSDQVWFRREYPASWRNIDHGVGSFPPMFTSLD
jgi:hypothetical protein